MKEIIWNSELYHYGIPRRSGRYKWGSGEDPYHHGQSTPRGIRAQKKKDKLVDKRKGLTKTIKKGNKAGSDTSSEQKKRDKLNQKIVKLDKRIQKENAKVKDFTPKSKTPTREELDAVIRSGDAKKILANKNHLDNSEMQQALKRVNTEKALKSITKEQEFRGLKKLEKAADVVSRSAKILKTFSDSYDTISKIAGKNTSTKNDNDSGSGSKKSSSAAKKAAAAAKNAYAKSKERNRNRQRQQPFNPPDIKLYQPASRLPMPMGLPAPRKKRR